MDGSNGLALGDAVNLVKGYAPGWDPATGVLDVLYRPAEQPIAPQALAPSGARGNWGFPAITLHDTAESLVTALLGYAIEAPAIDQAPPSLPAGGLMLSSPGGAEARRRLSATLGVSLDNPVLRYALVKLTRADEVLHHTTKERGVLTTVHALRPDPRLGVNGDFMRSMARLRHFHPAGVDDTVANLTQGDANAYLDTFARWGTHFVSSIVVGDQIVQVFAYDADRFERVRAAFDSPDNNFTGIRAADFQHFTTDANRGAFGFVRQYGKILCFSNARVFQHSLAAQDWVDKTWAKQDSVFQLFGTNTAVSLARLNKDFTDQAPIGLTLGPLTTFTEYKRTAVWRRVFKAAMSSVFGDAIDPNFVPYDSTDFAILIPEDQPGVVSTIATPTINLYKTRLNLAGMQLVARSEIRKFISYGYVIAGTSAGAIELPGADVRLYGYILDMRTTGLPNVVSLSNEGFEGLAIGCDRFLGVTRFQTADGRRRFLVADGLRYDLDSNGWPSVTSDVRRPPMASDLATLKDSLEFSLAFGEAVLGIQTGEACDNPTFRLARGYMKWIGEVIPADVRDKDLQVMRFRALDLGSYAPNAGYGAFVPILPAADYEDSVKKILDYLQEIQHEISLNTIQIDQRKQAELTTDVAKTLNENIVRSGEMLTGLIKANVQLARDVSSQYDSVIAARRAEAKLQQENINTLSKAVFEQQAEVDQAVQQYKAAVAQWEAMSLIKFGLDVATATFSLGTAILIPASSIETVRELGLTAQRIQKTLDVLNATMNVYTTVSGAVTPIQDAQKALDGLDDMGYGDTAALNWDEMSIQLDTVMSTGPSDSSVTAAKNKMVAAFQILALRGKALTSAQSGLHQIQRDIYTTQRQKLLNDRQAERLDDLVGTLKPAHIQDLDKEAIDLVGLTGSLDYLRRQMLTIFAKSFLLQDQALQYAWLQEPTPIASYSLLTFMQSRIAQSEATLEAKSQLLQYQASTTKPITIDIEGVLVTDISKGHAFEIVIDPNTPVFREYVNLRAHAVVAEVLGVKATDGGKLLVKLVFEDKPYTDRNVERTSLCFHTPRRERVYQFDVATGKPDFSDHGKSWSSGVSPVTPFGSWLVSLPETQTNRGLVCAGMTVTIRLTFVLEARIVDAPMSLPVNARSRNRILRAEAVRGAMMALAANGAEQPSADGLISHLSTVGTTTNKWDVVFSMGLTKINSALRDQYDALMRDTTYKNTVAIGPVATEVIAGAWEIKTMTLEYGYPLLEFFPNNNSTVMLTMPIEKGELIRCLQIDDTPPRCDPPIDIAGKTMKAFVNLSQMAGQVAMNDGNTHNILKVELNLAVGAFTVEGIEFSDEQKVQINTAIQAYFVSHPVVFLINALDLTNVPVIDALKPNGFRFKVLLTESGVNILQLFIQTGNREMPNSTQTFLNLVPEPLPLGSETSLLIRSELFFSEILPSAMSKSSWTLAARKSSNPFGASWGEFTNAPVSATDVDLSGLTQTTNTESTRGGSITQTTYFFPDKTVTWNLSGMTLMPASDGQMKLSGSKTQTMTVDTHTTYSHWPCISDCSGSRDGSFTNDATSMVEAVAPVVVGGAGRDQTINITMQSRAVTVTGHVAGGGPSGSDDLEAKVNQQVKAQVPEQIVAQLNVSFTSVSLFAIKNLLFPAHDYITFTRAAVPGDMLVLGNFKDS
ncbi:hypothetical protein C5O80_05565 [Burkholderia sp. SRS-46]|nr:hypothetical protein C5O80_05565 [Burkholderia sp. SRS-46]